MLALVTSFLPVADTHRFFAVCRNWCSVVKEKRHPPAPELPWLVLDDDEASGKRKFFNMSEKKHYYFDIPELRGAFIVGSSFGWLFVVGPRLDAYLVNPFSGAKFSLPPLPFYHEEWRPENLTDVVERDEDGRPQNPCFQLVQPILVDKAILSADPSKCTDFGVMIILNGKYTSAFCKLGDTTWTTFGYENGVVLDIIFFKGQLYALLPNHVLVTVDVGPEPKFRGHKFCLDKCFTWGARHLVDYYGGLMIVVGRRAYDENDDNHPMTSEFRVFKIDLEGDDTYEVEDIKGDALFLGNNYIIVVESSDFKGCIANSLYFAFNYPGAFPKRKYGYDDMGVYKLEDGNIERFYPPIYDPPQSCPIWLMPNPGPVAM
ncbi:hypothetical protein LUZ60_005629 [Juncus effusus]|nr:hypothetical protein LUZ60_005629 [Juncus effusus]